jgi:pimeloyl-ACP methyl ester carboxylesterase
MPRTNPPASLSPPALVLLPGMDGTGQLFRWFVAALPSSIKPTVVTFPATACTYAVIQRHARASLPLDQPFVLLGESFSGPLALALSAENPTNLVGVILAASFVSHPLGWVSGFAHALARPFVFRLPGQTRALQLLLLGSAPSAALVAATIDCLDSLDPSVLAARARAVLKVDASDALLRCPVPILSLEGRRDRLIPTAVRHRIRFLRPDAEIVVLDAPHFLLQRAPEASAQVVARFLSRLCASANTPPMDGF